MSDIKLTYAHTLHNEPSAMTEACCKLLAYKHLELKHKITMILYIDQHIGELRLTDTQVDSSVSITTFFVRVYRKKMLFHFPSMFEKAILWNH